jgi:hypothetical protein
MLCLGNVDNDSCNITVLYACTPVSRPRIPSIRITSIDYETKRLVVTACSSQSYVFNCSGFDDADQPICPHRLHSKFSTRRCLRNARLLVQHGSGCFNPYAGTYSLCHRAIVGRESEALSRPSSLLRSFPLLNCTPFPWPRRLSLSNGAQLHDKLRSTAFVPAGVSLWRIRRGHIRMAAGLPHGGYHQRHPGRRHPGNPPYTRPRARHCGSYLRPDCSPLRCAGACYCVQLSLPHCVECFEFEEEGQRVRERER